MSPYRFANRRDMCHFVGRRAKLLNIAAAANAWYNLAEFLEQDLGNPEPGRLPKFIDLLANIRGQTIRSYKIAKRVNAIGIFTNDRTITDPADLEAEHQKA